MAELTGGIAHDINNLLTVIIGATETLAEDLSAGSAPQDLALVSLRAAEHGAGLLRRLTAFAGQDDAELQSVDCAEAMASIQTLAARIVRSDVALEVTPAPYPLYCAADAAELQSALLNLCVNARDALTGAGRLKIRCEAVWMEAPSDKPGELATGSYARFTVQDNGMGMSPEVLRRAAEPFFTTKGSNGGTGLGLSSVQAFARQSGGGLKISSRPGEGTSVELYLPRFAVRPAADRSRKIRA